MRSKLARLGRSKKASFNVQFLPTAEVGVCSQLRRMANSYTLDIEAGRNLTMELSKLR